MPIIHVDFDDRDETVAIEMIPKGSGSENGSFLQMLIPADGVNAIKRFVIDRVIECGGRVCPPTIVGVGIGGTSDLCMHLAKVAATRPLGTTCADPEGAKIEAELSRGGQRARHRPAGARRPLDLVPRPCRGRGDPHHDEPGRGEHPVPLGAPRPRDDHARRHRVRLRSRPWPTTSSKCRSTRRRSARCEIGDTVTLEKTLFGIRDATLIHMFDRGRRTSFDLQGPRRDPHRAERAQGAGHQRSPAGYEPICIGTTTSQRMERFTRPLMEREGVRIIIGKGGMGQGTLDAFRDLGGAYLAMIGGAAALETTWIEAIEDVDLDDLHPESLWRFRIKGFGPLLVTMDSHGGSLLRRRAARRGQPGATRSWPSIGARLTA